MADLQTLIDAIPGAQDGDIITAAYLVTIKAALAAIVAELGASSPAGPQTVTRTIQPNLLTIGGGTAWSISLGVATSAAGSNGFISLDLPNGAVIQQMVAMGAQTSPASKGFVSLLVVPVAGTAGTTLIQIDLSTGGNPFTLTGTPNIPGLTPTALASMQTVQNNVFKYALQAEVLGASVTINAIQITYTLAPVTT